MALEKQLIELPLAGGIDTKRDPKLVQGGLLLSAKNIDLDATGEVRKRRGFDRGTDDVYPTGDIAEGFGLAQMGDVAMMVDRHYARAYVPSQTKWATAAEWAHWRLDVKGGSHSRAYTSGNAPEVPTMARHSSGIIATMAPGVVGSNQALYVEDETTGHFLTRGKELWASGGATRLDAKVEAVSTVSGGAAAFIIAARLGSAATSLEVGLYFPATDAFGSATPTTITLSGSTSIFDMCSVSSTLAALAYRNSSGALVIRWVSVASAAATAVTLTSEVTVAASADFRAVGVFKTEDGLICVVTHDATANEIKFWTYEIGASPTLDDSGTVASFSTANATHVIGCGDSAGMRFFWQTGGPALYTAYHTAGTVTTLYSSMRMVSKALRYGSGDYVLLRNTTNGDAQPTFWLWCQFDRSTADQSAGFVYKIFSGSAGNTTTQNSHLAQLFSPDGSALMVACARGDRAGADGTVYMSVRRLEFDPSHLSGFSGSGEASPSVCTGGKLGEYAGGALVESGFDYYPETPTLGQSSTGGSLAALGVYSYRVVYEWIDAAGDVHYSAPSVAVSITLTGGNDTVTLTLPRNNFVTMKTGIRTVVYRTVNGGAVYYRAVDNGANSKLTSATTHAIVDTAQDAAISDNEVLYIEGGVLENIAPPAAFDIAQWQRRVVVLPQEDRRRLWVSKPKASGVGLEFSDVLVVEPTVGDDITAIAPLGDRLLVFFANRIQVMYGDGPDNFGNGVFAFADIPTRVGAVDVNSVVLIDDGVLFKSSQGIYLIDRGLSLHYIGEQAEDFNAYTVTGAAAVPGENKVVFGLASYDGQLVYDTHHRAWYEWTIAGGIGFAVGVAPIRDAIARLDVYGRLNTQGSTFLDDGSDIQLDITTAWIKVGGLQGFQRLYWMALLGEIIDDHTLTVDLSYDYDDTVVETITVDTSVALTGGDTKYQLRFKPARQKCQAIKMRIRDSDGTGTKENLRLTGLALQVGVKGGINRLKGSKTL